jgi:hypothetical protein
VPYTDKSGYPIEQASKLGHLKMIGNPTIVQFVESFEQVTPNPATSLPAKSGAIDVADRGPISRVVTVDGGQAVVPHPIRREKAVAFIQVAACLLRMEDLRYMRDHPMMDPRDLSKIIDRGVWHNPTTIPLSGVRMPGRTTRETIRLLTDATLTQTGLYETLKFLVYREWQDQWTISPEEQPHLHCLRPSCGAEVALPRHSLSFECPSCGFAHRLADYLTIGSAGAEDWATEEAASALRDVLETLVVFHFVRKYHTSPRVMGETLFIKDGPLLLRAALSRLVEPIRAFISHVCGQGCPLRFVGVEKTGALVTFLDEYQQQLPTPGDFFAPSARFVVEEITGDVMSAGYRNRVSYGAKVAVRVGPDHVLALNVPTGEFLLEPRMEDLIGFAPAVQALSQLVSYQYPNALIPLVLANSAASIARRPSGDILRAFVDQLMSA